MPEKRTAKRSRAPADPLLEQVLNSWDVNNAINLLLIDAIPTRGFAAVPLGSRGRTVAQQLAHMHWVRVAWLKYEKATEAKNLRSFGRAASPSRRDLKAAFRASGKAFADFVPANAAGRLLWRLGRAPVTDLLEFCDEYLTRRGSGAADPIPAPKVRSPVDSGRLERLLAESSFLDQYVLSMPAGRHT